jgi:hypothetical protein
MSALTRCDRAIVTGRSCGSVDPSPRRAGEDVLEERAARALHRAAADLLVVVRDEQLRVGRRGGGEQGGRRAVAGAEVVQPRGGDPRAVDAGGRARLGVGEHEVVAEHVSGVDAGDAARWSSRLPSRSVRAPQTGHQLGLRVELEPSRTPRSRWMASDGRRTGPPGSDHQVHRERPVGAATASRPATVSSRSSQVWASSPPYGSTPTSR